jgi:hypothetical protein
LRPVDELAARTRTGIVVEQRYVAFAAIDELVLNAQLKIVVMGDVRNEHFDQNLIGKVPVQQVVGDVGLSEGWPEPQSVAIARIASEIQPAFFLRVNTIVSSQ